MPLSNMFCLLYSSKLFTLLRIAFSVLCPAPCLLCFLDLFMVVLIYKLKFKCYTWSISFFLEGEGQI